MDQRDSITMNNLNMDNRINYSNFGTHIKLDNDKLQHI